MSFDFMKEFMMFEDEERFAGLCEQIEEAIRDIDAGENKVSELEIMQALDFVGFNLFRDQSQPINFKGKNKRFLH